MSLASEMWPDIPGNIVKLPPDSKRRIFDRDFTLREIICKECSTVLAAIVIAEEHEADFIWPFDVICGSTTHSLVPKGSDGAAIVCCYGRPLQEWEAKKYLEKWRTPRPRPLLEGGEGR